MEGIVKLLEAWLGRPLFERHNRRGALTEAGAAYLAEVGAALDRIALATARQVEQRARWLLRVNALATFTMRWLIPRLSAFQLAYPAAEVRLTTANARLPDLSKPFDVAIRDGPDQVPGHVAQPFLSETRIPVGSPALLPDAPGSTRRARRRDGSDAARGGRHRGRAACPLVRRPTLPARSYCAYVPEARADDPAVRTFCEWLLRAATAPAGQTGSELPAHLVEVAACPVLEGTGELLPNRL